MTKFGVSQPVRRREDVRLLKGEGRFIDDIAPPDALHAVLLLSPVAHATIMSIDTADAMDGEGVWGVYTADCLEATGITHRMMVDLLPADAGPIPNPARPVLAKDKVRFVGEPLALVVADTLSQARDAAEVIVLDYEELVPHLSLAAGGDALHEEAPDNISFDWQAGDPAAVAEALAVAPHRVVLTIEDNRIIVTAMEPRGCLASWDGDRLQFAWNGQGVWAGKEELACVLGLPPEKIQTTTPDVGGGFGMKSFMYPEYFAVAQASRLLGRPVRWMGTRTEAMLNDNAGRDLTTEASLALDADGRITALGVETVCNIGAYNSLFAQNIQSVLAQKVITGAYDIPQTAMSVRGIFTNTAPVDAYRGAGRPEGIYIIERLMDAASRQIGIDPYELRRRNFIRPAQLPYRNFADETIDVGNFARVLDRAVIEADTTGFPARKAASRQRNRLRGLGLCYYIETILGDPDETTEIVFCADGHVDMMVGTQSNGQGHETAYAQILHERSGIPFDRIRVVQGDSDRIPKGGGTGGSRSVTTQGTSINATTDSIIKAMGSLAAECLEADEAVFEDGAYRAPGTNRFITLMEVGQEAVRQGRTDLVSTRVTSTIQDKSFPNGAHLCEVEIDPETGACAVVRYTVVDDLGVLINPLLVMGQVHGGVVQGIGQALQEHVVFDDTGQLLTASFMDYTIPRAAGLSFIDFHSEPTPSLNNPIGMKGCGEAGTIGALAAVANAVQDALWEQGVRNVQIPLTPHRIWQLLHHAG